MREDPKNAGILYVGTDLGVYVSTDAAKSWNVLGGGLPTVHVHDLIIHPDADVAVIATHGRGMYALDIQALRQLGPVGDVGDDAVEAGKD